MLQRWIHWSLSVCFAFTFAVLLTGCREGYEREAPCKQVDKTEQDCLKEAVDSDVLCQGVIERVEYLVYPGGPYTREKTKTLLRLQDGSNCLLDESIDSQLFNGMPTGTPFRLFWKRVSMDAHTHCEHNWHKVCNAILTLEKKMPAEKSQP